MTIADAFETCQLGHRTDAATNQGVEAAAGSLDLLEQHRIGIGRPRVGCIDGEPHLHPAALDPQRKLSGEDATLQSVRGAAAGVSGTSDRITRRPFGRSSTRLLKTSSPVRRAWACRPS